MNWDAARQSRLACAALVLLLSACGGGGDAGGGGTPALGLTVNPSSIAFAAPQNGPLPLAQNVQVTLTRADVFVVVARFAPTVSAPSWLPSTPQLIGSGANWALNGSVTTTALAPGTYTTTVRIEARDASQAVLAFSDVQVSYTVQPPGSLSASPSSGLTFSQINGEPAPAPQSVGIFEPAGGSFAWSASIIYQSGSGWLNVNSGATASGASLPASLNVSVTPQSSTGTFSATIRVTWVGPTLDIPVMYTVRDSLVTPASLSLSFSALRLGPIPATKAIALSTQGGLPVAFTGAVTYGTGATGWLTVPASGTAPGAVTAGVNTTTLAPGTYTATFRISTASQTFAIAVTYVVSEPVVTPSIASLSFSALRLGPNPATQDITLGNASGVAVPFTTAVIFAGAGGWLTVPASGSAPGTLTVGVNTTTLAPGTYTATLRINTAGQSLAIGVSYVVSEPVVTPSIASLSFSALRLGPNPATQDITLSNPSGVAVPFTTAVIFAGAGGWLTVPASGSAPGTLTVGVNTTTLAPGTYTATLTLSTAARTIIITVTFVVSEPVVTPSPSSLTFSALRLDALPLTQSLTLTTQSSVPVAFTAAVSYGAGASGWLNVPTTSGTAPATITVGVNTTTLAPATYNATLVISTPTKTLSVPVTYVLSEPVLSTSSAQLNFNAFSTGTLPASRDVTLSTQRSLSLGFSASIIYGAGATGWLDAPSSGTAPTTISIGVNTSNLVPGTYTATVVLTTAAQTVPIGITYAVATSSLTISPSPTVFTINASSAPSALSKTFTTGSTGVPLSWTATADRPWLTITPKSGVSGVPVTLSLDPAQLDTLDAGTYFVEVTFSYPSPNEGVRSTLVDTSLNLLLPKVNYVSPYVQLPNTSTEVILRGNGFNNATGRNVMFGNTPVPITGLNVVSDTEIRVSHPSLAAGSYPARFENQLGLVRSRASLLVVTPTTFVYHAIPTSLIRDRIVFDAERVSVYTNNWGDGSTPGVLRVERHHWNGSAWITDSMILNGRPFDIAITPDGRELIALTGPSLYHIDLNTWTISKQIDITSLPFPLNIFSFVRLAMSNDGNALVHVGNGFITAFLYNVLTGTPSQIPNPPGGLFGSVPPVSSLDGRRILVGQNSISGPLKLFYFDTSLSQFVQALPDLPVQRMTYDRTGSVSIIDGTVFDRQFQALGSTLRLGNSVISPDGTRAYAYGIAPGGNQAIFTFDLTSPDGIGGFTELTPITFADFPGEQIKLGITPDGKTVFISGDLKFIVQPVP